LGFVTAALLTGCGGAEDSSNPGHVADYPLVTETAPARQAPITTPSGALVQRPVKPSRREIDPSPSCERIIATFHDGRVPAKQPIVVPPAPGLRAVAVSDREVRLEWSFRSLPDACRPAGVLLSVIANDDSGATPTNKEVEVATTTGAIEIAYPDFLPPPDVAMASAYMPDGRRSRTVRVLISR
jgi:hypothetical protein